MIPPALPVAGAAPILEPGTTIAPGYRILAHLRQGHDLDVYDGWSEERRCRCVIKVLRLDRRDDRAARARLVSEGRLLLRLAHPHIVRAYALLREPFPVLILETLTGQTLARLIAHRRRPLPLSELQCLGFHVCSALHYVHGRGMLHLDLKPSNVVCERGLAKLLDFSIARRPGRCRPGLGTDGYMAPEQARGGAVSEATDVWGIGCLLFEAATRLRPRGPAEANLGAGGDRSVRCFRRLPPVLGAAIDACLHFRAAERPTVDELAAVLAQPYDLPTRAGPV